MSACTAKPSSRVRPVIINFLPLRLLHFYKNSLRNPLAAFDGDRCIGDVLHLHEDLIFWPVVILVDDADGMRTDEHFFAWQ